jgi:hypothetical protein
MSVTIETVQPPEKGRFSVVLNVQVNIEITADEARRQVGVYAGNHIADLLSAEEPALVVQQDSACWRVPVVLSSRSLGRIGIVGAIDVNVESSELLVDDAIGAEIAANADRFAAATAL